LIPLFLIPLLSISNHSAAQNAFEKTYGGEGVDEGYSVQQTSDGGYIVAGSTQSFGAGLRDVYLIKTDSSGDTLWTKTFGGGDDDFGWSVKQTTDGGYIIAGITRSFGLGSENAYLIKTDALGDTLWTKTFGEIGGSRAFEVQQTSDGGYVVVGDKSSDVYLIKTDGLGDTLWTRTYGGDDFGDGFSVQQTSDGGYVIAGLFFPPVGDEEVYLIKTDSFGDTLWTRTYGGSDDDWGTSVRQTSDGGYIITGVTGFSIADEESGDVYLLKTNASGDTLWTKSYGGEDFDSGREVGQTSDGGYFIVGYTHSFGGSDVYLIKTDSFGDSLWTRTYDSDVGARGFSGQQTADGEYILAGYDFATDVEGLDVYLIHTDTQQPTLLSAAASDNAILLPGIDSDDQVLIQFSEPTNQPLIDATNIDQVLSLSGGHTWTDALGEIEGVVWGPAGDRILVSLSTNFSPPTIAVGDTITPDGMTIKDSWGNVAEAPVVITGSFDPVGIGDSDEKSLLPRFFSLSQNYPNPFNPMTTIRYTIPEVKEKVPVQLTIHDLRGRLVRRLFRGEQSSGYYQLTWDGRDEAGQAVGSGIYLYTIHAGSYIEKMKMTMIR
jgi:hypothetical protein